MNLDRITIGKKGESLARSYLKKKGFYPVASNFRTRYGEIDIIARKEKGFHFIEVKFRRSIDYGLPQESVIFRKQQKIRKTALLWLKERCLPIDSEIHFDVLAIISKKQKFIFEFLEDAF